MSAGRPSIRRKCSPLPQRTPPLPIRLPITTDSRSRSSCRGPSTIRVTITQTSRNAHRHRIRKIRFISPPVSRSLRAWLSNRARDRRQWSRIILRRRPTSSLKDIVRRNSNEYLVLTAATYHTLKILSADPTCTALHHPLRVIVPRASISSRPIGWSLPLRVSATGRTARTACTLPPPPAHHRRRQSARVSPDQEAPLPITFLHNRSRRIFRVTFLHRICCRPPPPRHTITSTSSNSSICSSNSSILVVSMRRRTRTVPRMEAV